MAENPIKLLAEIQKNDSKKNKKIKNYCHKILELLGEKNKENENPKN